jgi:uncharacterized small protein (DUF1192 family)
MSDLELTMMRRVGELNKEVARLKAEVYRLEEIVGADAIDRKYGMCCDASDEVARLKAELESLTKAGDELGEWFMDIHPSKKKWNAAKEGKGQP